MLSLVLRVSDRGTSVAPKPCAGPDDDVLMGASDVLALRGDISQGDGAVAGTLSDLRGSSGIVVLPEISMIISLGHE